jgi:hypothetical protein
MYNILSRVFLSILTDAMTKVFYNSTENLKLKEEGIIKKKRA